MKELKIVPRARIKKENLNKYHYTISLLQEALQSGLLGKQDITSIQQQIMLILKELILQYTGGESSSVKTETAESIQKSILYTLDAVLSSYPDPEEGLSVLKEQGVRAIYEKGIELLKSAVTEARKLYEKVRKNKLDIPLEVYNTSIDEALPDFFRNYGIVFNAHDTMTMLDYPLVFDYMKVQGVFYIKNYLHHLYIENQFCQCFSKKAIAKILANYGRIYRIDYIQSPINVFEVVASNAIFSVIISILLNETTPDKFDTQLRNLTISKTRYDLLDNYFTNITPGEVKTLIDIAVNKLIKVLEINNPGVINYIQQYKTILIPRIINSVENNSLHNLIITNTSNDTLLDVSGKSITLVSKKCMDDKTFRSTVQKIKNCNNIENKIDIIQSSIHSLEDFTDMLEASCLYGDEYKVLYNTLTDLELAVLLKFAFPEAIRDINSLSPEVLNQIPVDREWQRELMEFLKACPRFYFP